MAHIFLTELNVCRIVTLVMDANLTVRVLKQSILYSVPLYMEKRKCIECIINDMHPLNFKSIICPFYSFVVSSLSESAALHDWHCCRDGLFEPAGVPAQGSGCSQLHASCFFFVFVFFIFFFFSQHREYGYNSWWDYIELYRTLTGNVTGNSNNNTKVLTWLSRIVRLASWLIKWVGRKLWPRGYSSFRLD